MLINKEHEKNKTWNSLQRDLIYHVSNITSSKTSVFQSLTCLD